MTLHNGQAAIYKNTLGQIEFTIDKTELLNLEVPDEPPTATYREFNLLPVTTAPCIVPL